MQSKHLAILIAIVALLCIGLGIVAKSAEQPKEVPLGVNLNRDKAPERAMAVIAPKALELAQLDEAFTEPQDETATHLETAQSIAPEIESAPTAEETDAFDDAQIEANEATAFATLRSIASAQAMAQAMAFIDVDGDGIGEYGYFGELAGTAPLRGTGELRNPALIGNAFGDVSASGTVERDGYLYRIVLPGAKVGEQTPGFAEGSGAQPDAEAAERMWSLYAWPAKAGVTGERAFFINQAGNLTSTTNTDGKYSGESFAPSFDAALSRATPGDMAAPVSLASQAQESNDGEEWTTLDW